VYAWTCPSRRGSGASQAPKPSGIRRSTAGPVHLRLRRAVARRIRVCRPHLVRRARQPRRSDCPQRLDLPCDQACSGPRRCQRPRGTCHGSKSLYGQQLQRQQRRPCRLAIIHASSRPAASKPHRPLVMAPHRLTGRMQRHRCHPGLATMMAPSAPAQPSDVCGCSALPREAASAPPRQLATATSLAGSAAAPDSEGFGLPRLITHRRAGPRPAPAYYAPYNKYPHANLPTNEVSASGCEQGRPCVTLTPCFWEQGTRDCANALCKVGLTLPGSASQLAWGAGAAYRGSGAAGPESDSKQATQLRALAAYTATQAPTGSSRPARRLPRPRLRAAAPAARRRPQGSARARAVSAPLRRQPSCTDAAGQGGGRRRLAGALAEQSSLHGERTSLPGMKCRLTPALLITIVRMQPAGPAQRGYDRPT